MTRDEIREAVIDIIADIAPDEDLSSIDDEKPLREQIGLDSMDFLDIVMELRKRHRIEVPEEEYPQLVTMKSTIDYLQPKMSS
jgi:acyl carrier protein